MARPITLTPVLEPRAAKKFMVYVTSAKRDQKKVERLESAKALYRRARGEASR